ncbi:MAG: hypothetical protein GX616_17760, partial [Planctomycetes bacterium]|nr:hypothetical protein [Planctomycetota bacterium]
MKTADNTMRRMAALMVVLCATIPLLAATPSDLLDKAVDLFREGKYQQAQEALLEIDREQLPAERRDQRDELMEEITTAVNQSGEAAQDLEDALAAQARKDLNAAEKRFQEVIDNKYASDAQKRKAAEGLALVKKQRDLAGKIQVPQTATRPAGTAASRPADAFRKAREERARIEAALKIKAGEDAAAKGQYDLAEQHFEEALKLVPNHPAAIHGLQLIKQHRSVEGKPNLIDETANRALLRWTRTVSLYQQSEGEIRGLINDRKYDEARRRVADAGQLLDAGRLDASPPSEYEALRRELDGLGQMIDVEEKDVIEEKAIKDRKITLEIERERERRVGREKMERIGELFNQAEQLKRQKEYEMSAELLREAMAIDPTYERAKWQLEAMEDAGLIDEQVRNRELFLNKMQDALLEADQAKAPRVTGKNDEIFAFPDEERWRLISSRDPYGVDGAGGETEGDRLARKALDTPLPADIQFPQGTTLRQAIDRLKEAGKITINVNWSALGMVGIDPDGTEVGDLSVGGVKLETALEMVLDMAGGTVGDIELGFDVLEGIILVSTTEDLNRKTEVRVYDVRDLLLRIRSLSVDENMGGMGMMGMGGMGMMGMGGMGM